MAPGARTIADIEAGTPLLMLRLTEALTGATVPPPRPMVPIGPVTTIRNSAARRFSQLAPPPFLPATNVAACAPRRV